MLGLARMMAYYVFLQHCKLEAYGHAYCRACAERWRLNVAWKCSPEWGKKAATACLSPRPRFGSHALDRVALLPSFCIHIRRENEMAAACWHLRRIHSLRLSALLLFHALPIKLQLFVGSRCFALNSPEGCRVALRHIDT